METAPTGTLAGEFWRNTHGQVEVSVEAALLGLVYISLGLRIWSRSIQRARYQLNDWLIFVATFLMSVRNAVEIVFVVKCGVGLHMPEVIAIGGAGIVVLLNQLLYVLDLLFVTIIAAAKVSILHFYSVIFPQRSFLYSVYATMGLCLSFWFAAIFAAAFHCIPARKKWYPEVPGHCGDDVKLYLALASIDFVLDIVILILPLPILWRLQLPLGKKFGLTLVFGLGLAIIIITAVRFKFFFAVDLADVTYTIVPQGVLSALVPLLGIVNANLPVMQPALKKIFGRVGMFMSVKQASSTSRSGASRKHEFERLGDSNSNAITLTNINTSRDPYQSGNDGQIRVTTDWEVYSAQGRAL
ncbi:hypothetical protein F4777DRAFT_576802 [Nemania sp. FL0916]|nr:hypothetical protein F4777DRAFT_576802 [Nemania sp. FL0916]